MDTLKILFAIGAILGAVTSGVQSMAIAHHTHEQAVKELKEMRR